MRLPRNRCSISCSSLDKDRTPRYKSVHSSTVRRACPAVKTIAFELADECPETITHVFCPAGGGGLCVAVAQGFQQLVRGGQIAACPTVECVQPEGNNTIAGPLRDGAQNAREVACTTQVSGLQVASVVDGHLAIEACRSR